jgi:fructose-specific phosphotransferase system IIC component
LACHCSVRFDLLPAVLAGYAVLTLAARPRLAQAVVAAATAVKFWPALMITPVVASDRDGSGAELRGRSPILRT